MTKILTPTAEHDVAARDGLWMSPADAETVTGWMLKPEGMCRAEQCVPLPASALKPNEVDLAAFGANFDGFVGHGLFSFLNFSTIPKPPINRPSGRLMVE